MIASFAAKVSPKLISAPAATATWASSAVSISAAPAMRELYDEARFEVRELQAARNVNCKKEKRAPVTELLIRPRVRG